MEMEHAKIPWRVMVPISVLGKWRITMDTYYRQFIGVATEKVDAEFIVEACNAHESLKAQRDALVKAIKKIKVARKIAE